MAVAAILGLLGSMFLAFTTVLLHPPGTARIGPPGERQRTETPPERDVLPHVEAR